MSYLSIQEFVDSGKRALSNKNYYAALSVALMLPSMCSRLAYKDNPDYRYINKDGVLCWRDRKTYVDFCDKCFSEDMWLYDCFGRNIGSVLYNLRCDIVHAGCANIYADDYAIWLSYGDGLSGVTCFSKYKIVNIESMCNSIFSHIEMWLKNLGAFNYQYTFVFNGGDRDDKLLYDRLCDKERADMLERRFIEELAEREMESGA